MQESADVSYTGGQRAAPKTDDIRSEYDILDKYEGHRKSRVCADLYIHQFI